MEKTNIRSQIVKELFKPARRTFPRRRVELRSLSDMLQIDLADMSMLAKENKGIKYLLVAVNPFSKMTYLKTLKTKGQQEVVSKMQEILDECGINFQHLFSDRGTEFKNKLFEKEITKKYKLNHYFAYSSKKCPHVERKIRDIKQLCHVRMNIKTSQNYVDDLPRILDILNERKHSRFGFAPNDVNESNEDEIFRKFYAAPRKIDKPKFEVGAKVRLVVPLDNPFLKAHWPRWSPSIFTIVACNYKYPCVYKVKDYDGKILPKTYYEHELQLTRYPDFWLVEKVISKRGKKCKVKWLGYDDSYNSWVDASEIYEGEDIN
jgi:hypothetical protein